jgi:lysophospholipase L1-like esterase
VKGWTEGASWTDEPKPTMKLALGAVEALTKEFSIDPDRLYVTGLAWEDTALGTCSPECPNALLQRRQSVEEATRPTSLARKASLSGISRNRGSHRAARSQPGDDCAVKAAGGAPLYSEYPYIKHDSWTTAYGEPELLPWMFAQRRGAVVPWDKVASHFAQPPSELCPGVGPMQSGIWFRPLWQGRREQWSKDVPKDQGAVVFFGDSITQGWGSLEKDFPNTKVANRGSAAIPRAACAAACRKTSSPLSPRRFPFSSAQTISTRAANPRSSWRTSRSIVGELHKANPKLPIVINKVMPRGAKPGKYPDKIKALNALYEQAFSGNPQITFCDTWSLFDAGDGQCKKEEFPDMLHPNGAGYAKWTEALRPILAKLGL